MQITPELYDKIHSCNQDDFVYIENNISTYSKIQKIDKIDSNRIYTKEFIFSKESTQCVTRYKQNLYIKDIIFNISRVIEKYFKFKNFSLKDSNIKRYYLKKNFKSSLVEIFIYKNSYNYKESSQVVIICNDIIIFSGDIFNIDDLEIIYKCTLKKLE